jgi:glycosyltransferase involved in cell wall biosynthesis
MSSVVVLLSTYNGARYLRQQLDSLLGQDYPVFRIRVRDDGSTDDTVAILQEYAVRHAALEFQIGTNLGTAASFFELLRTQSEDADLVAFCDQDDVWDSGKISRAVDWLTRGDAGMPRLYFSRLKIVDNDLRLLGMTQQPTRPPGFGNALTQNIAAGCTMMLNRQAVRLLTAALPGPRTVVMHDWWIYLVISAFGLVEYDRKARILYRQHGANYSGARTGVALWWQRLTRVLRIIKDTGASKQISEFSRLFAERLPFQQRRLLELMLAVGRGDRCARWQCALSRRIYRQGWVDDLAYRLLIVFGRR